MLWQNRGQGFMDICPWTTALDRLKYTSTVSAVGRNIWQRAHLSLKKYSFARLLLLRASTVMLSMCGENLHAGSNVSSSRSYRSTTASMPFR